MTAPASTMAQTAVPVAVAALPPPWSSTLYAECVAAPIGASECTVRLVLEVEGEVVFDEVRTIPVNEDGIVEPALVRAIRDRVLRSGRKKLTAHLRVLAPDGAVVDETRRTDELGPFTPPARFMHCGVPLYSAADGGSVTATWGDEREVLTGDVLAAAVVVREAGFTSNGRRPVSFTVARDARRRIDTVRVSRGKVTARHLFFSGLTFPCTTGKTIRVGRRGLLR